MVRRCVAETGVFVSWCDDVLQTGVFVSWWDDVLQTGVFVSWCDDVLQGELFLFHDVTMCYRESCFCFTM